MKNFNFEKSSEEFRKKIASNLASKNIFFDSNKSISYTELNGFISNLKKETSEFVFENIIVICDKSFLTYCAHIFAFLSKEIWIPVSSNSSVDEINSIVEQLPDSLILFNNFDVDKLKINQKILVDLKSIKFTKTNEIFKFTFDKYKTNSLFFTSGSTGKPKGVKLNLLNIFSNLENMQKIIKINRKDKFLDAHEVSFVISIPILIFCFFNCSTLIPIKPSDLLNFKKFYKEKKFSTLITVPTLLKILDKSINTPKLKIRNLITCGEPIERSLISNLWQFPRNTQCPFSNATSFAWWKMSSYDSNIFHAKNIL